MAKILITMALVLCAISAEARTLRSWNQSTPKSTFPYTVQSNDSIFLETDISTPQGWLILPIGITNWHINGNNKTVRWDTTSTNSVTCILANGGVAGGPNNGDMYDFTLRGPSVVGHGLPLTNLRAFIINGGRRWNVTNVDMLIDGHNARLVHAGSFIQDSIIFDGGDWYDSSLSFQDREQADGAVWYSNSLTPPANGTFNVIVRNITLHCAPYTFMLVKGKYLVEYCYTTLDARNLRWDSVFLDDGIEATVGESADNCYHYNFRDADAGTIVRFCRMFSGQQYQGSRGMLIEYLQNTTASNGILIYGCYGELNAGPTGENLQGIGRGIRWRNIDGPPCRFLRVESCTLIVKTDTDPATTAIGQEYFAFEGGCTTNKAGTSDITLINNVGIGLSYSSASNSRALPCELNGNGWSTDGVSYGNTWLGSSYIFYAWDAGPSQSLNNYSSRDDIFGFVDTTLPQYSGVKLHDKATFYIGSVVGQSWLNNEVINPSFINGASPTNVVFGANAQAQWRQKRELTILVRNNSTFLPIAGASVTVRNAYGNTFSATTDGAGLAHPIVTYRYDVDHGTTSVDSAAYSPMWIIASSGAFSDSTQLTVAWNSYTDTVDIGATAVGFTNLDSLRIDSLRNDFSGNVDSIQFRAYTATCAACDSFVVVFGTSGYPAMSQTTNRIKTNFVSASTFTLKTTLNIDETDTLYATYAVYDGTTQSAIGQRARLFTQPAICDVSYASANDTALTDDTVDIGIIQVGQTGTATITIQNVGGSLLSGNVTESCTPFAITAGTGSFALSQDQSRQLTITFTPTILGVQNCTLTTGIGSCPSITIKATGSTPTNPPTPGTKKLHFKP